IYTKSDDFSYPLLLEKPKLVKTDFNIRTINPQKGSGPADSWTSVKSSVDDMDDFFRGDKSFKLAQSTTTKSSKTLRYLNKGGKVLVYLGAAVAAYDIIEDVWKRDWEGAVCDGASYTTSYLASYLVGQGGAAVCAPLFAAGGVPGVACAGGVVVGAGAAGYFTFEATQDICHQTWDRIEVESDMFDEKMIFTREEMLEIKKEAERLGYGDPMQLVGEGNFTFNQTLSKMSSSQFNEGLMELITPQNESFIIGDTTYSSSEQYFYEIDGNNLIFTLNDAEPGDYKVVINNDKVDNLKLKVNRFKYGEWVIDSTREEVDTLTIHLQDQVFSEFEEIRTSEELNTQLSNINGSYATELRIQPGVYNTEWSIINKDNLSLIGEKVGECILNFNDSPGLLFFESKNVVLRNLVFDSTSQYSVSAKKIENFSVSNSIFKNCSDPAVNISEVDSSKVTNNTFVDNEVGISVENSDLKVVNNIFANSNTGVKKEGSSGEITCDYNNFYNTETDHIGFKLGPNNLFVNPLFVSEEDLHLQESSPCIDTGSPEFDYSLEPSPNGERINMGVYGNTKEAQITVDTKIENQVDVPSKVHLSQNYPNPFNPETKIKYYIKNNNSKVELVIFNIAGQKVDELVNDTKPQGTYTTTWQPNCQTGIYFYRLTVDGKSYTKKMLFIK
ncbi:MAG TPA: T9SS type A sorting domain-containing protein, partial [Candidatus Paceibacterota bacterium]|nr:T9SS type A sorting domain-containing protein [Candidatus Paceibacterota bacterium]